MDIRFFIKACHVENSYLQFEIKMAERISLRRIITNLETPRPELSNWRI